MQNSRRIYDGFVFATARGLTAEETAEDRSIASRFGNEFRQILDHERRDATYALPKRENG